MWLKWDEDGDGQVSLREFKHAVKQLYKRKITENELNHLLEFYAKQLAESANENVEVACVGSHCHAP